MPSEPADETRIESAEPTPDHWAGAGHRLHWSSVVFELLINPFSLLPLFALLFATGAWLVLIPLSMLFLLSRILQWRARSFAFDGVTVRLDQGVFGRSTRRLPIDRIQEVEIIRSPRHQLLGVSTIEIQSAGGVGGAEIRLNVLRVPEAEALRDQLLHARDRARRTAGTDLVNPATDDAPVAASRSGPTPNAEVESRPVAEHRVVLSLSSGRLAMAGATGPQLLAVIAVLGWIMQTADDLPDEITPDIDPAQLAVLDAFAVAAIVLGILVVWIIAAVAAAVLTYHGLTVTVEGDDLKIKRGLLNRRETVIPRHRVELVSIGQNPARRVLGYGDVTLRSAGSATRGAARGIVPMLTRAEQLRLLHESLPDPDPEAPLVPAPRAARIRVLLRSTELGLVVGAPFLLIAVFVPPLLVVPMLTTLLGSALGIPAYRSLGHHANPSRVLIRSGSFTRRHTFVPTSKIQSARATSTLLQRRRRLATLHLDLAGSGSPAVREQSTDVVEHLVTVLPKGAIGHPVAMEPLRYANR